jgi:malate permease and related proteins
VQILAQALFLVGIIAVGWGIKQLGWVRAEDFRILANIVLRITLPSAIIVSFNEVDISAALLTVAAAGLVINVVAMVLGLLLFRGQGRTWEAFGMVNLPGYNVGAFAVPYLSGFLGPQAIVYAGIFDVGNALSAGGLGYGAAVARADADRTPSVLRIVLSMFRSPMFDVYLILLAMRFLDLSLPDVVIRFLEIPASANTFLAMLMLGVGLQIRLDRSKIGRAARILVVRYALALLLTLVTWFLVPWPEEVRIVVCMLYWSPIASMATGFTSDIRGDVGLSAFLNSATILVGLAAMPIALAVLG